MPALQNFCFIGLGIYKFFAQHVNTDTNSCYRLAPFAKAYFVYRCEPATSCTKPPPKIQSYPLKIRKQCYPFHSEFRYQKANSCLPFFLFLEKAWIRHELLPKIWWFLPFVKPLAPFKQKHFWFYHLGSSKAKAKSKNDKKLFREPEIYSQA